MIDKYELNLPIQTLEDHLFINFDYCPPDKAVLMVMRHARDSASSVNTFYDNEAIELYNKLTNISLK